MDGGCNWNKWVKLQNNADITKFDRTLNNLLISYYHIDSWDHASHEGKNVRTADGKKTIRHILWKAK